MILKAFLVNQAVRTAATTTQESDLWSSVKVQEKFVSCYDTQAML